MSIQALVLCNVGNSDVLVDDNRPKQPRPEGEQFLKHWAEHRFTLPIIEPCLAFLLKLDTNVTIARLVFFYTDQPDNATTRELDRHKVSLRDKDTIWYAHIAKRFVQERFGERIQHVGLIPVERNSGEAINPSIYDETFEAYGDLLMRGYTAGDTPCYVLMAGGIPACNTALQIQALSSYGKRCHFIYQPEGGQPANLRVGTQIQDTFRRATALEALARADFATVLRNIEETQYPDKVLVALLRYACYREAFDFERARRVLNEGIQQASGEMRTFLQGLIPDLERLVERNDPKALLLEVYVSADMTFNNGRYADFLGRVFRFQEAVLRYIVEDRLELPTDMGKKVGEKNLAHYLQGIDSNPALKSYLDTRTVADKRLVYEKGPNREVMIAMLDFLTEGGVRVNGKPYLDKTESGRFGELRKRLIRINDLAQLRNRCIIAHGYAGVSREELDTVYGGDAKTIMDDEKVIDLVGLEHSDQWFTRIANVGGEWLRRHAS